MKYVLFLFFSGIACYAQAQKKPATTAIKSRPAVKHDVSERLSVLQDTTIGKNRVQAPDEAEEESDEAARTPARITIGKTEAAVEQTTMGTKPAPTLIASFEGLGESFVGPQGTAVLRNPSDNSLAVGPDHIVQTVNSRMAIFTKKGKRFNESGKVLYGPVDTKNVFRGFGGPCERINNGDAVVRYDQLADRWLIVMPTFRRDVSRTIDTATGQRINISQPGKAEALYQPPVVSNPPNPATATPPQPGSRLAGNTPRPPEKGNYCMCYAISTTSDPMGPYYRYEFERELFPDYPRPAVWPDGYYTATSTGDNVIERHAYVVDRNKMLKGEDAKEQYFIVKDVNFLVNADLDGKQVPPPGAPNMMLAAGGTQLKNVLEDDGLYAWNFYVNWDDHSKTKLEGPVKIPVAPYHYLGGGQLTKAVPQPDTDVRLDAQGDKLMARVVYRRIGKRETVMALHSVATAAGGGGVRWYELTVNKDRSLQLYQQSTYAPDANFRWMGSGAIDGKGNIGIGYSFGGPNDFPGQRFAGRLAGDTPGQLTLREAVLVLGEAPQTNTLRWQDYTQTAVDPSDDRTIWYVGDYLKKGGKNYSTRIGAFKIGK